MDNPEREMEAIHHQVGGWFEQFVGSPLYETLTAVQQDQAAEIVWFFTEYAFRYVGVAPDQWNRSGLTECCVEVLPRRVSAGLPFFQAVAPVLSAFFTFLAEKGQLRHAGDLAKTVAELDEQIVAVSQDPRYWGPAKAFIMAAEEAGVDPCDQPALDRFLVQYNLRLLARLAASRSVAPAAHPPTVALPAPATPAVRSTPKTGRNDPCPCGSGKKFKKCCGPQSA